MIRTVVTRFLLTISLLLVVGGLWCLTLIAVPYIVSTLFNEPIYLPTSNSPGLLSVYGTFGDMFGAVNALFSGLALSAVALTLWLDLRARRESRKPLVVCSINSSDGFSINRPRGNSKETLLPIKIFASVSNQTHDAALNVKLEIKLQGISQTWTRSFDGPLVHGSEQNKEIEIELSSEQWKEILGPLTLEDGHIELTVKTIYNSLEGVLWQTDVTYKMSVRNGASRDLGMLNALRAGSWGQDGHWDPQSLISLAGSIKVGSWKHQVL